jgi:DNA-binding IclR family transcriptional regulator
MMRKKAALETPSIQSLARGLSILEAVADASEPVPLKRLTDLLGIDRSSVFRLANTLKQRRFLSNPEGRKEYILGPSAWRLSRKYGRSMLLTHCHGFLRSLAATTGETAHLAVREGNQALFLDHSVAVGRVVTVSGQTGEFVPLHCTAHGKALLADFTLDELTELFGTAPLRAHSKRSISSLDRLAKVCIRIAIDGVAIDDGEFMDDLRCVAAPIRDQDGLILASVGISAPITRFPKERFAEASRDVLAVAKQISDSLAN